MKRHVVIGFDARDHVAIGKEYTDIFEMDYIPLKMQLEDNS